MKIFNFGSLNIDKVYQVADFVSAGATITAQTYEVFAGGKGLNQSVAAARAGASVAHVGAVGGDGGFLLDLLRASGVDVSQIVELKLPSGHAVIQVNRHGENCIIVFGGANHSLSSEHIDAALVQADPGDIALLQNETNRVGEIMLKAREKRMKIVFNPSPIPADITQLPLDAVDCFILNESEGAAVSGAKHRPGNGNEIADKLSQRFPGAQIVLTLGRKGVVYKDAQFFCEQPAFDVQAIDTTAAGDTFCGYFLAGLCGGLEIPETLLRASAAAALAISGQGAAPSIPTDAEVSRFVMARRG